MGFCNEKEVKRFFQKLSFCKVPIEKRPIKHLKNIDLLILEVIKRYARRYRIEIIDSKKTPLVQLGASKSNIEDLFKDLLDGIKLNLITLNIFAKETQRKWRHRTYSCLF